MLVKSFEAFASFEDRRATVSLPSGHSLISRTLEMFGLLAGVQKVQGVSQLVFIQIFARKSQRL